MTNQLIDFEIPISKYPADFIPVGGTEFVFVDKTEFACSTVKGFRDIDGVVHVQSIEYSL